MKDVIKILSNGTLRAVALLVLLVASFFVFDRLGLGHFGKETAFSVLQYFATFGPVALGLGLTIMVREFDISIAGMFGLGSCIAVVVGRYDPVLGLVAAIAIGLGGGAVQGLAMVRLGLSSVAVSLGGLLTFGGLAYLLTGNRTVSSGRMDLALIVNSPILEIFSFRSLIAVLLFAITALFVAYTRTGRDMIAVGGDRQAATTAGVKTDAILIGTFAVSGFLSAVSGGLLSFSLAAASPAGLSDVSVPAVAAVILGGASFSGGTGRPLGTATGVLILGLLRTGLTALGVPPYAHEIVTGGVLLSVAIADGGEFTRRLYNMTVKRRGWFGRDSR
jgi:ribose/xylose/arabinose/galactoside ABC-type transport system permease subunit